MTHTATTFEPIPAPPAPGTEELIDEVLADLPAPPRARRRVLGALLTGISIASLALCAQLKDDVAFALSPASPVSLGDGRTANPAEAGANRMVTLRATASMAGAVTYSRPLYPGEFLVFPIAGRDGVPIYVQVDRSSDAVSRGEFTGRLIPFSAAGGRYAGVGRYLRSELSAPVTGTTWLLVDGAAPRSTVWAPIVASLLLALSLTDLGLLLRLLRPSKP